MITQAGVPISDPQRRRALDKANAVRLARAALKRRIIAGDLTAAEVILGCPDEARSWSVGELLASQRRWGTIRCRKFLARNQVSETKAVGALTHRQRVVLADALGPDDPGRRETASDLPGRRETASDLPGRRETASDRRDSHELVLA